MLPFTIKWDCIRSVFILSGGIICRKMPDVVSLVTTGLGVSILAGVLSGVCYVFVQGIRNNRVHRNRGQWYCEICGVYLNSTQNILNEDIVTCFQCGSRICREKCAKPLPKEGWLCRNCATPRRSWLQGVFQYINPNITSYISPFHAMMEPTPSTDPDGESLRKLEKDQVRDFIEKLVNVMLGENVDNASVSMLYNDKLYLPVTGQSPCTAHAALKEVIERLLKEAINLPLLEKAHAHPAGLDEDNKNKNYEDLLATAIINKVISSCQNNLPSSSANSVSSRLSNYSQNKDDKEYFFSEETLENKWKTTDLDTTSVSSLEEWIHSESSYGSRKYVDKVTLMIKQDIEEVDNLESEPEEDDVEYFRSTSSLLTDSESNWLLQRRHFQGTPSPVPVPMLVPNPTTEAKVLIGDKPLDDTSDLSDVGSDFEETEAPQATHSLIVHSKNVIGGGNTHIHLLENSDGHSESSTDSGVKEVDGNEAKSSSILGNNRADITVDDDNIEDSSYVSVYSNTEKEAEYTEKYESLPRHIVKHSNDDLSTYQVKNHSNLGSQRAETTYSSDNEFYGNYSRKEKEKWNNAIKLENNPYSTENIEKRLKRSRSAASSLYDSKHLTKLARMPSGGSNVVAKITENWPPTEPPREDSPPPPSIPETAPPPRSTIVHDFLQTEHSIAGEAIVSTEENILPAIPSTVPPARPTTLHDFLYGEDRAVVLSEGSLISSIPSTTPPARPSTFQEFVHAEVSIGTAIPSVPLTAPPSPPTSSYKNGVMREAPNLLVTNSIRSASHKHISEHSSVATAEVHLSVPKTVLPTNNFKALDHIEIKRAEPAIVIPDNSMPHSTIEGRAEVSIVNSSLKSNIPNIQNFNSPELTSDSDLSFVNSYDVEHSQVIKETKAGSIHIPIKNVVYREVAINLLADENENDDTRNNNVSVSDQIKKIEAIKTGPVAKPRSFVNTSSREIDNSDIRVSSSNEQRHVSSTYISQNSTPTLTRHLSDSNLLDDSFDAPPRIVNQKKDNTLISKIYRDPKVRMLARGREDLIGGDSYSQYQTQMSYESTFSHDKPHFHASKERIYLSSEDGLSSEYESGKTGRMSFFDSEDDLRSVGTNGSIKNDHVISTTNQNVATKAHVDEQNSHIKSTSRLEHSKRFFSSSQDDLLSIDEVERIPIRKNNTHTSRIYKDSRMDEEQAHWRSSIGMPRLEHSRRFFSSSQDDLLAIDEVGSIPKRKDNTLISKIYKDPRVLQFALSTHGDNIPNFEPTTPTTPRPQSRNVSSSDDHFFSQSYSMKRSSMSNKKIYKSYEDLSSADISLEGDVHYGRESQEHIEIVKDGYNSEDIDIDEIERKHLVRNALGKFTQSEININATFERSTSQDDEVRVSVKDLRKKFETTDGRNYKIVSSLTARSLSKKIKDTLKL